MITSSPPEPFSFPVLAAAEAASAPWGVVVIGAGPAGTAAALRLARAGRRVLLIDRHTLPRPKVCGCCLSPLAMAELRALGFGPGADRSLVGERPLNSVHLMAAGRSVRLPLPRGAAVSREVLDTRVAEAAVRAGAGWLQNADAIAVTEGVSRPGVEVLCRFSSPLAGPRHISIHADTAVIATGLSDRVRTRGLHDRSIAAGSRIGAGTTLPADAVDLRDGELVMAVGRRGYCGLVRLEDGRIDVAAAVDGGTDLAAQGIGGTVADILDDAGAGTAWGASARRAIAAATFRATPPLTRSASPTTGEAGRTFRIGDAAGYVEPFTGEGMGWALASGRLVAEALLAPGSPATAYASAHDDFFRRHHRRCRRVATVLRHPLFVHAAIRVAAAMPWAAGRLVPMLVGGSRPGALR